MKRMNVVIKRLIPAVIIMMTGCAEIHEWEGWSHFTKRKEKPISGDCVSGITSSLHCNHVADKRSQYRNGEQYLDACIESIQRVNKQTLQYNAVLSSEMRRLDKEINNVLRNRNQSGSEELKSKLEELKKDIEKTYEDATRKLARAKAEVKIQEEVYRRESGQSRTKLASLDNEIYRLKQTIAELEQQKLQIRPYPLP